MAKEKKLDEKQIDGLAEIMNKMMIGQVFYQLKKKGKPFCLRWNPEEPMKVDVEIDGRKEKVKQKEKVN